MSKYYLRRYYYRDKIRRVLISIPRYYFKYKIYFKEVLSKDIISYYLIKLQKEFYNIESIIVYTIISFKFIVYRVVKGISFIIYRVVEYSNINSTIIESISFIVYIIDSTIESLRVYKYLL